MGIYIFSRPIHSGKTTALQNWCMQQKNITGILMPDINGSRKILNLTTNEIFDIECKDPDTKEPLISVGKFLFYSAAFEKANTVLIELLAAKPAWLVIDEAGKLELNSQGFFPAILKALEVHDNTDSPGNLLLTVRDSLVEDVIAFFKIKYCQIIYNLNNFS